MPVVPPLIIRTINIIQTNFQNIPRKENYVENHSISGYYKNYKRAPDTDFYINLYQYSKGT